MSKLITINTEKLIQSKKYKSSLFITFVVSILIFSMLSTSVFASNVINLDYNTYKYLMSLDNVNYAINYNGYSLDTLASINATISTLPESQSSDSYLDSPITSNINGRYITSFTMYYGTYLYIPIMLSDIDTISFDFYCGVNTFNVLNSININSVSFLDFFGTEISTLSLNYTTLSDPSFYKSYNLVTTPDPALPQWTPNLSVRPYHIDAEFPIDSDVGFIRIVMSAVYGSECTMFYGANNFNITSPDKQITSLSTMIQGNLNRIHQSITNWYAYDVLHQQQILEKLSQIIDLQESEQEQMEEIKESFDDVNEQLDQISQDLNNISKPSEDNFDFNVDSIAGSDYDSSIFTSSENGFSYLINNSFVSQMISIVIGLACPSFLLFGKR